MSRLSTINYSRLLLYRTIRICNGKPWHWKKVYIFLKSTIVKEEIAVIGVGWEAYSESPVCPLAQITGKLLMKVCSSWYTVGVLIHHDQAMTLTFIATYPIIEGKVSNTLEPLIKDALKRGQTSTLQSKSIYFCIQNYIKKIFFIYPKEDNLSSHRVIIQRFHCKKY